MRKNRSFIVALMQKATGLFAAGVLATSLVPATALAEMIPVEKGLLENSFEYEPGERISVEAELLPAEGGAAGSAGGLSPFAAVDVGNGQTMFDGFDQFTQGYYTDNDAKRVVDVSEWQHEIDWHAVKASGVDYAIIRCGFGDMTKRDDKYWLENVRGCQEAGIPFGVYLYSYAATPESASSEADHALACLAKAGLTPSQVGLPIYFDMEDKAMDGADYAALASAFCDKITAAGYEAGVYASLNWWNNRLTDPVFDQWYKWQAAYNTTIGLTFEDFKDFRNCKGIWQFSSRGRVPGISTNCDLNYTYLASVDPGESVIPDGKYRVKSLLNSGRVLDVSGGGTHNAANIQVYDSNESRAQAFDIERTSDGYYVLRNDGSGKVLDVESGSLANGGNVQQYDYNGTEAQQWRIDHNGDGTYTFINKGSGRALDLFAGRADNGTNVQQYTSNGTLAQKFTLERVGAEPGTQTVPDGIYAIGTSLSATGVLDIPAASTADGANVQIYEANGTSAQKYSLRYDGNGYYTVTNVSSNKALDVAGGDLRNSSNVQQYTSNGTDAQKWRIDDNGDGTYTLLSKKSGKALDVAHGSTENGANIQVYESNGTHAQRFTLLSD